jgi:hypothetical protein
MAVCIRKPSASRQDEETVLGPARGGDCATEPTGFASSHEAYAALRLHDGHGPECKRYLAAHAYVSAELDD